MKKIHAGLNNANERLIFVQNELTRIPNGMKILDAGCGSQRYKKYCNHLEYYGQDFAQYDIPDKKNMLGGKTLDSYKYGELNYIGNIWEIEEKDSFFDVILCTEVFEHIPYPNETLIEFTRLLKPGGRLILTAPSNCLRHMDPYFFYSGFSEKWYEKFLMDNNMDIEKIENVGDYYSWLKVEIARTALHHSLIAKILLLPAFIYYLNKKPTEESINTLVMGYHVVANKKQN
jgi:2-polyprenyl-3-methyl-5-hydroxy-6-metoxy-1,4-benzoquinol methylase